jgi:hypothetical protein
MWEHAQDDERRTRGVRTPGGAQEDAGLETHTLSSQVGYLRLSTARLGVKERVSAGTTSLHRAQQPASARSRPSTAGAQRPGLAIRNDPTFLNSPVVGVLHQGGAGAAGDGGVRRPCLADAHEPPPFCRLCIGLKGAHC